MVCLYDTEHSLTVQMLHSAPNCGAHPTVGIQAHTLETQLPELTCLGTFPFSLHHGSLAWDWPFPQEPWRLGRTCGAVSCSGVAISWSPPPCVALTLSTCSFHLPSSYCSNRKGDSQLLEQLKGLKGSVFTEHLLNARNRCMGWRHTNEYSSCL